MADKIVMVAFVIDVDDEYKLKQCIIEMNLTGLHSDWNLLTGIAKAILTNAEMEDAAKQAQIIIDKPKTK